MDNEELVGNIRRIQSEIDDKLESVVEAITGQWCIDVLELIGCSDCAVAVVTTDEKVMQESLNDSSLMSDYCDAKRAIITRWHGDGFCEGDVTDKYDLSVLHAEMESYKQDIKENSDD